MVFISGVDLPSVPFARLAGMGRVKHGPGRWWALATNLAHVRVPTEAAFCAGHHWSLIILAVRGRLHHPPAQQPKDMRRPAPGHHHHPLPLGRGTYHHQPNTTTAPPRTAFRCCRVNCLFSFRPRCRPRPSSLPWCPRLSTYCVGLQSSIHTHWHCSILSPPLSNPHASVSWLTVFLRCRSLQLPPNGYSTMNKAHQKQT